MKGFIRSFSSFICIIVGALLASFSVACILLPNDAIDYGTAGIGIIISKLTGMPLSICVFVVFLPFLIASAFILGRSFVINASVGSLAYMIGIEYFENIPFVLNTEHFIAVCFGGAILGAGLSLILRFGGCIDGSEIFANVIVNKIHAKTGRNISMTGILIAFNACVYAACFILINRDSALLSMLVYFVATLVIDHFTDRFEAIKQVRIITQYPEELVHMIRSDLNKTVTMMDSYGAIAGQNKTLICYVTYFELFKLKEIIKKADHSAYVTVSTIDEIVLHKGSTNR